MTVEIPRDVPAQYRFETSRDVAVDDLVYELEVRGWQRESAPASSVVALSLPDFLITRGLLLEPEERALAVMRGTQTWMDRLPFYMLASCAFALAFVLLLGLLAGLGTASSWLLWALVAFAWIFLPLMYLGTRLRRRRPAPVRARLSITADRGRTTFELDVDAPHDPELAHLLYEELKALTEPNALVG